MSIATGYREWLRRFPKKPADRRAAAQAAVDTVEAYESLGSAVNLAPLVLAACSPHKLVFERCCNLLVKVATRYPEAGQCLVQMARYKDATARFRAVAYLDSALPQDLRLEIVALALGDRSGEVRQKGIERAEEFGFRQLLLRLEEMQRSETDPALLRSLAFHVPILRDGFLLKPSGDGRGYYLTVRGPTSLSGFFIPEGEYSEEYLLQEVARLRAGEPSRRPE